MPFSNDFLDIIEAGGAGLALADLLDFGWSASPAIVQISSKIFSILAVLVKKRYDAPEIAFVAERQILKINNPQLGRIVRTLEEHGMPAVV